MPFFILMVGAMHVFGHTKPPASSITANFEYAVLECRELMNVVLEEVMWSVIGKNCRGGDPCAAEE